MSRIFLKFETSPRPSIRVLLLGVISICSGFKVTKYSQVPEHQVSFSTKHVIVLMITVVNHSSGVANWRTPLYALQVGH